MTRKFLATLITATCCLKGQAFNPNSIIATSPQNQLELADFDFEVVRVPAEDVGTVDEAATESLSSLPPVIQQIADERREFQLNLGKAMDTLKKDMPEILRKQPGEYERTIEIALSPFIIST
jgi:hypothetical protein